MRIAARTALSGLLVVAALLAAGCASTASTSLETSWVNPQLAEHPYKKVLIITVASDEMVQEIFQGQLAAKLSERGMHAVASRRYFTRYTEAEKERFKRTIHDSDADAVLLARVTGSTVKTYVNSGVIVGAGGVPIAEADTVFGAYAHYFAPTSYQPGSDGTTRNVAVETSLYARKGEKLVWVARTRTTNADNGSDRTIVAQFVDILLNTMAKDKVL